MGEKEHLHKRRMIIVSLGFWVFMLITELIIPLNMIGLGDYFLKNSGPKKINKLFGYRTSMSMKNEETWKFAHRYVGKLWRIMGWITLPLSVGATLLVLENEIVDVGMFGGVLIVVQAALIVSSIIPTEIALKKHFDKNGNRRA